MAAVSASRSRRWTSDKRRRSETSSRRHLSDRPSQISAHRSSSCGLKSIVDATTKELKVVFIGNNNYALPCEGNPDIVLTIGGTKYAIKSKNYFLDMGEKIVDGMGVTGRSSGVIGPLEFSSSASSTMSRSPALDSSSQLSYMSSRMKKAEKATSDTGSEAICGLKSIVDATIKELKAVFIGNNNYALSCEGNPDIIGGTKYFLDMGEKVVDGIQYCLLGVTGRPSGVTGPLKLPSSASSTMSRSPALDSPSLLSYVPVTEKRSC
uniref:Uncharacterized protein n=1 Tax=Steinernema glaseri TaxID=37863 RepID=A0A1I7Z642_9BILA